MVSLSEPSVNQAFIRLAIYTTLLDRLGWDGFLRFLKFEKNIGLPVI